MQNDGANARPAPRQRRSAISRAPFIVVGGPDGTGKSTLLALLGARPAFRSLRMTTLHFDPLPHGGTGGVVTDPHATAPRSVGQFAALGMRLVRYVWSGVAGPLSGRRSDLVVQARGWSDQLVDPRRYRLTAATSPFVKVLGRVVRRPTAFVLLAGDPAAIVARKPELTEDEIARQLAQWTGVARGRAHLTVDTTGQSPDAATDAIESFLVELRAKDTASRLHPVAATPRRLEMVATAGSGDVVRHLYSPSSSLAKALRPLRAARLPGQPTEVARRVGAVVAALGLPFDALAVIRSMGRSQAVVAVHNERAEATYVKITWGGRDVLRNEAEMLELASSLVSVRVPRVLDLRVVEDMTVLHLGGAGTTSAAPPSEADALAATVELRWSRGGEGITHGDFTHWNLLTGYRPYGLIDWEKATRTFHAGFDLDRYARTLPGPSASPARSRLLAQYADLCDLPVESLVESHAALGLPGDLTPAPAVGEVPR